ncbi:MAG: AAA family ATPase [Planctomycetes bacterium]|nr:AAA family ATPase [Planctomycetota bacterium]
MQELIASLNPEQRAAVVTTEGPVLVLAGAGSGKTRVITVRIAHLLAKGVSPSAVLAMTFTNKAAAEMRERVAKLVGKDKAAELTVGTFHAFAARLLREHGPKVGIGANFTICDGSDQQSAIKGALRELRIGEAVMQPSALHAKISLAKNRLETSADLLKQAADDEDELVARAWQKYDEHLRRNRTLDFDDLLLYALKLLREHKAVKDALARRYRYVMVDEYQDTNGPQYEIVRQIAGSHRNLCVVGDDDQSIYGWRGADITKILSFDKDFHGAKVVRLETNYRSTPEILSAANRVIRNNPSRHAKELRSALESGVPVTIAAAEDETAEAEHVVREIKKLVSERKAKLSDFAILFRTGQQPRPFEAALRSQQLPYDLVGGMSFFDRKEVRDVLAYLKLVANPGDETSLLRIVNCPPRGVGKTTLERVVEYATAQGISACEAFDRGASIPDVNQEAVAIVRRLREELAAHAAGGMERDLPGAIERLVERVGYRAEVERLHADPLARDARWAGVTEIYDFAANYQRRARKPSLLGFLEELTLKSADEQEDSDASTREAVKLMTLHAAKGLEFPRVYLVGLEEGLLPHARSAAEGTIEEERRLMYVGVTRAQRVLSITWAKARAKFGKRMPSMPSRFLHELKGVAPPKEWRAIESALEDRSRREKKDRGRGSTAGTAKPAKRASRR